MCSARPWHHPVSHYALTPHPQLPRVSYLTAFDKIILISFALIAAVMVESVVVHLIARADLSKAQSFDVFAVIAFPTAATCGYGLIVRQALREKRTPLA